MTHIAVAIDGPSGAGKSSIARRAARELNFIYVDTGALYRAVGYAVTQLGADYKNPSEVISKLDGLKIELKFICGEQRVFANGEDVSEKIRTPEMSMIASAVSAIPTVRDFLFRLQQDLAKTNDVIMDGRDIGTVVLPDARVKIFLTATAEERAKRRYAEHIQKGETVDFDELLAQIKERDYNDSHRAAAPLKQAADAVLIDTTALDFESSAELIIKTIKSKIQPKELSL